MEVYPETPAMSYPLPIKAAWKTDITDFVSGKEQAQQRWAFPNRTIPGLPYKALSADEVGLLWQFYMARKGSAEAFWFYYPAVRPWYGEYVGKGTGAEVTLDLPSKSTVNDSSLVLYANGIAISKTFVSGGGQGGSDRVTFTATSGATITVDFKGKLRLKMRYVDDALSEELFTVLLFNASLALVERK